MPPTASQRRQYTKDELKELLAKHKAWTEARAAGEAGGERAYLRGADLEGADLEGADLEGAYLEGAYLEGADLEGAYLRGAYLEGADLRGAYLRGAYLRGADLRGAYLEGAYLEGAYLPDGFDSAKATSKDAPPGGPKHDLWAVLNEAPNEVAGLRQALLDGRVDGSCYAGACACLVGTIANLRHCAVDDLPEAIRPNASRPAEVWFLSIKPGDTPDNHGACRVAVEWIDEWLRNQELRPPVVAASA